MVNCVEDDVRRIIDTGLVDADVTALIVLADAEINDREIDASPGVLKQISMLITASLAAMNDSKSLGKTDYSVVDNTSGNLAAAYRKAAEGLINSISAGGASGKPRARVG
jgi:hypothetical protein